MLYNVVTDRYFAQARLTSEKAQDLHDDKLVSQAREDLTVKPVLADGGRLQELDGSPAESVTDGYQESSTLTRFG